MTMTATPLLPRDALFDPGEPAAPDLPVCDHYAGVEARMRKALALQAELGPVFDLTLDCEDGAPVGGEAEMMFEPLGLGDERSTALGQHHAAAFDHQLEVGHPAHQEPAPAFRDEFNFFLFDKFIVI